MQPFLTTLKNIQFWRVVAAVLALSPSIYGSQCGVFNLLDEPQSSALREALTSKPTPLVALYSGKVDDVRRVVLMLGAESEHNESESDEQFIKACGAEKLVECFSAVSAIRNLQSFPLGASLDLLSLKDPDWREKAAMAALCWSPLCAMTAVGVGIGSVAASVAPAQWADPALGVGMVGGTWLTYYLFQRLDESVKARFFRRALRKAWAAGFYFEWNRAADAIGTFFETNPDEKQLLLLTDRVRFREMEKAMKRRLGFSKAPLFTPRNISNTGH